MSYGSNDLNTQNEGPVAPSIALSDFRGQRYPNQFFDLSQQYMPPTIKELFRWCTFYYYNSPLIGATMKKVSRYPITDLIFEDDQDSVRTLWEHVLTKTLKMKERLIEINLDNHVYGNAFISIHLPFTRFLICPKCGERQPIQNWDWSFRGSDYVFAGKCGKCDHNGELNIKDVPYKDLKAVRIVRWNPENIHIKFNEYTGRYIYMYTVPAKLRNMILRGDKDIIEDLPMIVIEALKKRRMIRFHQDAIFHMRAPTLAEQDQGWGKPAILHVLKDMFYFYTLRRAQEAIAMEHIVPCDIIYPLPNAQQDPYLHTDLANWKVQIETIIRRHRRDPNFKGVIPVPVGTARIGGDGKMLMLSPELNYLNQTVVGGLGMSSEMLFGNGMAYTGASIQLRMLENDFIQNRGQLIDLVHWIKDKLRIWASLPDIKSVRFSDFRMADDVQRNQQVIGLNAQGKLSDETMLTELGFDWNQETQKMILEAQVKNYLIDIQTKGNAKSQGEAQLIQFNYQKKINELTLSDPNMGGAMGMDPAAGGQEVAGGGVQPGQPQSESGQGVAGGGMPQQQPSQMGGGGDELTAKIDSWAQRLSQTDPQTLSSTLMELKQRLPEIGTMIEQRMNVMKTQPQGNAGQGQNSMNLDVNMSPMPVKGAPRRAEAL
jgi:hypothetical protein